MISKMAPPSIEISKDNKAFALHTKSSSYHFHIDAQTKDLINDHYGTFTRAPWATTPLPVTYQGWAGPLSRTRREYPEVGRGDFRIPGWSVRYGDEQEGFVGRIEWLGGEVRRMSEGEEEVNGGRGGLPGLKMKEREELIVKGKDEVSGLEVELHYGVLPDYDAITRSVVITNTSSSTIKIEKAASLCLDMEEESLDLLALQGDWAREGRQFRRKVEIGTTSFGSVAGYSSHMHNPSLALVTPETSEEVGECWGFALLWSGSFGVEVEKNSMGFTRVIMGQHEKHTEAVLRPGETFRTPEAVAVFSDEGLGGMSRRFHKLFRRELCRSSYAEQTRPVLLNSWEGVYFDFDDGKMLEIAKSTAELGIKLLVMDDGWFGDKYPRLNDTTSLGDWMPNPKRFPNGLEDLVEKVVALDVKGAGNEKLKFGIWVEPEMVSVKSELYESHPEWVLGAEGRKRTEIRDQLVLNLGLEAVQVYIIDMISKLLSSGGITYIKWDNNRGMHEMKSPAANRAYIKGLYHILHTLTTRFPDVLFEGCASGGGRFDAGILQYFPQSWTSDDTDAIERLTIQFGTSLVYPASSMGAHISAVPNHITGRTTPLMFRAHVAMMGGSFGFELDPTAFTPSEREMIPQIVAQSEEIAPLVTRGEMYRLRRPEDSKFPAIMFVEEGQGKAVVFLFQTGANVNGHWPFIRLRGLDPEGRYRMVVDGEEVEGQGEVEGRTLMGVGVRFKYKGEYDSKMVVLTRV